MTDRPQQKDEAYTGPCAKARAWVLSLDAPGVRLVMKRSRRWQYRQIAALDLVVQRKLDELGATFRQVRWVAAPGVERRRAEVDYRYRALAAFLQGRSPCKSFQALQDSRQTFDPHTGEAIPPFAPLQE